MFRKALILPLLLLTCSAIGAPDPDIFDGRVAPPDADAASESSEESSAAGETPEVHGSGAASDSGSSERDLSEFGIVGGGETVGEQAPTGSGSGSESAEESVEEAEVATGGGGSGEGGSADESPGGAGSGSGEPSEPRSFEDFGFGGVGSEETVEVNRSKSSGLPSRPESPITQSSGTTESEASESTAEAAQQQSGTSQSLPTTGTGDYGSSLPPGL
ncbi:MAG: hypothetical protein ACSHYA_09845 [Opitutaceae bacterium]